MIYVHCCCVFWLCKEPCVFTCVNSWQVRKILAARAVKQAAAATDQEDTQEYQASPCVELLQTSLEAAVPPEDEQSGKGLRKSLANYFDDASVLYSLYTPCMFGSLGCF